MDLGVTAVHETGHWLGLIHTFQAIPPYDVNPCDPANPNDYIADTPQMNSSSVAITGCPVNRDSCPLDPGLDPTNNFMDYGYQYDSSGKVCKTMFTPQQVARMQDVWDLYRVQNEICAINEFQFELQIQFDQNPQNTAWDIKFSNGTILHQSITDGLGVPYNSNFAGQTITVYKCFPLGTSYVVDIYSASGNGIASPGYYRVYINGTLFAQGGQDFKTSKAIPFGAASSTTLAPTSKPSRPPSLQPTSRPTIKASPTAPTVPIKIPSNTCFSNENTVEVENIGTISIRDLQIGDKVRSAEGTFVTVYSFGHYQSKEKAEYIQIHARGVAKPIEVSKDHLMFVGGIAVPASMITLGNFLDSENGPACVTQIMTVNRFGAYAPFTASGTLMVNGVAVSSYVSLQEGSDILILGTLKTPLSMHWLAHVFQAPHRMVCMWSLAYCKSESYTKDGISVWVATPLHISRWFIEQNGTLMGALFIPALLFGLLIYVVEAFCMHPTILFVSMSSCIVVMIVSGNGYRIKTKSI